MILTTLFCLLTLPLLYALLTTKKMPLSRAPSATQVPTSLPGPRAILTTHAPNGNARLHSVRPLKWTAHQDSKLVMSVAYTTSFPAQLTNEADISAHDKLMSTSDSLGLVKANGTVLRYVDIAPGHACMMHRTLSLDYGIVLEGEVTAIMGGSGEEIIMGRGDVMVQRATMHQWRNDTKEWVRMIFCLQDCQPLIVGGESLGEDLQGGLDGLVASGNDIKIVKSDKS